MRGYIRVLKGRLKNVDSLMAYRRKDGSTVFTARWWPSGHTAKQYERQVRAILHANIIDSGHVRKPSRDGARISQSSHFFVKFTIE